MGIFNTYQVPYSALQRGHENAIAAASATGAGIIIRGGAALGAPTDWEHRTTTCSPEPRWDTGRKQNSRALGGMGRMEFTLRFTLSNPDLDTTIVGTSDVDHLRDTSSTRPRATPHRRRRGTQASPRRRRLAPTT